MKEAYLPREETLLTEIRNWKNTENLCKGVYDDGTLKSRNFLRLKMQTYRRLYRKYRGTGLSLDEEALHRMLRYHYKKIEKELYPSLPVRLGRRGMDCFGGKAGRSGQRWACTGNVYCRKAAVRDALRQYYG